MIFLLTQEELNTTNSIIYFFSHDSIYPINKSIFHIIQSLEEKMDTNAICVDLSLFSSLSRRFQITELPTFIMFKDGTEIKRITGIPTLDDI